jgi:hypothetical protein
MQFIYKFGYLNEVCIWQKYENGQNIRYSEWEHNAQLPKSCGLKQLFL